MSYDERVVACCIFTPIGICMLGVNVAQFFYEADEKGFITKYVRRVSLMCCLCFLISRIMVLIIFDDILRFSWYGEFIETWAILMLIALKIALYGVLYTVNFILNHGEKFDGIKYFVCISIILSVVHMMITHLIFCITSKPFYTGLNYFLFLFDATLFVFISLILLLIIRRYSIQSNSRMSQQNNNLKIGLQKINGILILLFIGLICGIYGCYSWILRIAQKDLVLPIVPYFYQHGFQQIICTVGILIYTWNIPVQCKKNDNDLTRMVTNTVL